MFHKIYNERKEPGKSSQRSEQALGQPTAERPHPAVYVDICLSGKALGSSQSPVQWTPDVSSQAEIKRTVIINF
jgi:hypothetical protein